jgi:hypothetical protein
VGPYQVSGVSGFGGLIQPDLPDGPTVPRRALSYRAEANVVEALLGAPFFLLHVYICFCVHVLSPQRPLTKLLPIVCVRVCTCTEAGQTGARAAQGPACPVTTRSATDRLAECLPTVSCQPSDANRQVTDRLLRWLDEDFATLKRAGLPSHCMMRDQVGWG